MKSIRKLFKPFVGIVFPETCICCGQSTASTGKSICNWCCFDRFESAEFSNDDILPSGVKFQFSMWQFDKGGYLQKLLHDLKYNFMMGVGEELGFLAGKQFKQRADSHLYTEIETCNPIILPVPLHQKKERKRGYNQARAIANGLQRATNWEIAAPGAVSRVKQTKTQTGLSLSDRSKNLKGAFRLNRKDRFEGKFVLIIDDVYTTGATTFELAGTLFSEGIASAGILTIAKA